MIILERISSHPALADKKFCAKEPRVQAAVAQLNMALMLTLGILSCMTTGWWGSVCPYRLIS